MNIHPIKTTTDDRAILRMIKTHNADFHIPVESLLKQHAE